MMQKDKKDIILSIFAKQLRMYIPEGKAPTTHAVEYGISSSIMSESLRGLKDVQLTTFIGLSESLNIKPDKFMKEIMNKLPEGFSLLDL